MSRRKTNAEFKREAYAVLGNKYVILDKYIDSKTKIRVKHLVCNTVHKMIPSNILRGATCKTCADKKRGKKYRKSNTQFKQEVYDLVGDEYTVLSNYVDASVKVRIKHNVCGYKWWVSPSSFLSGVRCPKCRGGVKKSAQQFEKELNQLVGDEYTLMSTYRSTSHKIKVRHNKCNYTYWVNPDAFLRGERCPKCFRYNRKTLNQFKQEVYNLVGDEYTVLSKEYKNNKTKIEFRHNKCNRKFKMTPVDFLYSGHSCIWCYQHGSSHGNDDIAKILDKYNVVYAREYKFDDCKDKRKLPFDFYLPDLNICIEYDGKQHTDKSAKYYSTITVKHDHIKDTFCNKNNIKLIRISYKVKGQEAIENYLKKQRVIN